MQPAAIGSAAEGLVRPIESRHGIAHGLAKSM